MAAMLEEKLVSLQEVKDAITEVCGHEYLYFDKPVRAKTTTFSAPFCVWAACVSPFGQLFVMDGSEQWHEVEDRPEDQRIIYKLAIYFHLTERKAHKSNNDGNIR